MKTILLYLLVSTRFLFAQLSERDTSLVSYVATVQGSLSSGNVERTLLFGSVDIASRFGMFGLSTENTYIHGSVSGKTTENDWFSKNFFYYAPEEILYPYVMFWWEANKRKQIESRYQIGAGGTYVFRPHIYHTLKTSLTVSYEQSDYTVPIFNKNKFNGSDKMSDEKLTLRTFYTAKIAQHLTLSNEIYFQQSIRTSTDYRVFLSGSISSNLVGDLSTKIGYQYTKENIVPIKRKQDDFMLFFGLTYSGVLN